MSNKNNPIQAVKITQRDFRETPPPKSGPKPLREVTKELVDKLQSDIDPIFRTRFKNKFPCNFHPSSR